MINILVFCEYVYKVKLAILGLNVNNFATGRDILMKLNIQRALIMVLNDKKIVKFSKQLRSFLAPFL